MSIRKRVWTNGKGEEKTAWICDYVDAGGKRRLKTFLKKKDADAFEASAKVEIKQGVHVADSASSTVQAAGDLWIASATNAGLERTTVEQYQQHLRLHIAPFLGATKLTMLSVASVRAFADQLREAGRSPAMVRKVLTSLGSLLGDAQERGLVARNVVKDIRGRRQGSERRQENRAKRKLKIGVDIPSLGEARAILAALHGRWRPLLMTAIFTGMRASELRGLRWVDVDFEKRAIFVDQRADRYRAIGRPKTVSSASREIPLASFLLNVLREWRLVCPKHKTRDVDAEGNPVHRLEYVFPNGSGNVENLKNIVDRGLKPIAVRAGVSINSGRVDKDGKPIMIAKYTGMHSLRHFYASWCINRVADGGLGLPAKVVQERLGHSTVAMTLDVYGHLFPRGDDAAEMDAAERSLLA